MRVHDGESRLLPARIRGLALMLSYAVVIATSVPANGAAGDLPGTGVQFGATDSASEEGKISRASDTNRSPDPATPAASATGNTKKIGNDETALLLDWHSDANDIYGAIHPFSAHSTEQDGNNAGEVR